MKAIRRVGGFDIGGANVKAVRLDRLAGEADTWRATSVPLAVWRHPDRLEDVLAEAGQRLGLDGADALALTMTAELADAFRTKREGVTCVCRAVAKVFPEMSVRALSLSGRDWPPLEQAFETPLDFAANNWLASALYVAARHDDALFVDIGSTTTDIIPIRGGRVAARGLTDTERLTHGELVYTGILRTNPNTLAATVPIGGRHCRTAAEHFAAMADVHLLLGHITADDYTSHTADGRGTTPAEAAERLARLVCADVETLAPPAIREMAAYLFERQLAVIAEGLLQVLSAQDTPIRPPLLPAGSGAFLVRELGRRLGMAVLDPLTPPDPAALAVLPALAAASLLADRLEKDLSCSKPC
ncbi:MAG TPA: hydantoinase/oxoprolinase family protein [Solidesulfovibrio magneticus]|nr:hydantoinase/oxoprolinase family protein [Solidesulfovibrio magneticus]